VARETVLRMFPGAQVEIKLLREYPIMVSVEHVPAGGGPAALVWKGRQQGLFSKNRHAAVPEIEQALMGLKDQLALKAKRASYAAYDEA